MTSSSREYPCVECQVNFSRKKDQADHLDIAHSFKTPWICHRCPEALPTKDAHDQHRTQAHQKYAAGQKHMHEINCSMTGIQKSGLHAVVERISKGRCAACGFTHPSVFGVLLHFLHKHPPDCNHCFLIFADEAGAHANGRPSTPRVTHNRPSTPRISHSRPSIPPVSHGRTSTRCISCHTVFSRQYGQTVCMQCILNADETGEEQSAKSRQCARAEESVTKPLAVERKSASPQLPSRSLGPITLAFRPASTVTRGDRMPIGMREPADAKTALGQSIERTSPEKLVSKTPVIEEDTVAPASHPRLLIPAAISLPAGGPNSVMTTDDTMTDLPSCPKRTATEEATEASTTADESRPSKRAKTEPRSSLADEQETSPSTTSKTSKPPRTDAERRLIRGHYWPAESERPAFDEATPERQVSDACLEVQLAELAKLTPEELHDLFIKKLKQRVPRKPARGCGSGAHGPQPEPIADPGVRGTPRVTKPKWPGIPESKRRQEREACERRVLSAKEVVDIPDGEQSGSGAKCIDKIDISDDDDEEL